jgi:hypothetical protein
MRKTQSRAVAFPLKLRGRSFKRSTITIVSECIRKFFASGRTRISEEICKRLNWRQPNGWLKDRACRDVLVRLSKLKLVRLPPRRKRPYRQPGQTRRKRRTRFIFQPLTTGDITLEFAKGNAAERTWNTLVNEYHYLGHKVVVGRCLKYLIHYFGKPVGAICFSSAAWELESRDRALQELGFSRKKIREQVINNSRFLIIPDTNVPNLASRALSLATKQVAHDWAKFYSLKPQVVETFVQPSRFEGTCYRAANWIEVGRTKGYAKRGGNHVNSQESKRIFLYGLSRTMRRKLLAGQTKMDQQEDANAEHNP